MVIAHHWEIWRGPSAAAHIWADARGYWQSELDWGELGTPTKIPLMESRETGCPDEDSARVRFRAQWTRHAATKRNQMKLKRTLTPAMLNKINNVETTRSSYRIWAVRLGRVGLSVVAVVIVGNEA